MPAAYDILERLMLVRFGTALRRMWLTVLLVMPLALWFSASAAESLGDFLFYMAPATTGIIGAALLVMRTERKSTSR